ncbi:aldehyde dehydrogenase [Xylanivirga thermophila]|jgi:aldehyde dehydrogenase (NAD+)|uniref:aldehyde dehydrogenase n=1 Tax=Xylanivirga thermophila TaxID=2496273 RepID=UPI00101DCF0A|nr:aldehyde dehydrogenase [Xylanivirga thermophila]
MLDIILSNQREYFNSGVTLDLDFRREQLIKLKEIIERNEEEILDALKFDLHKSHEEGYMTEVGFVLGEIEHTIKNLEKYAMPKKVKTPKAYFGAKSYILPEPYGVALIISPWNYPVQLLISPLIGAMAAGNCAILKPSELSPNTSKVMANLINKNFNNRYVYAIEGDAKVAQQLLKQRFDYIFYTGGTNVGKIVMQAAAENLTPVTLELGGKSPCIVDKDINIEYAAKRIAWGKFLNAGQTCVAPDYLLVDREVKSQLVESIKKTLIQFYGNDPIDSTDYCRIINHRHFDRLALLLQDGNIVAGGRLNREKLYISPTIIDDISLDDPVMQDEIFGPILPVIEYTGLNQAIDMVNSREKPLALYFFSKDKEKQRFVLEHTSSGGVCINDTIIHMTTKWLPFGGVGMSGVGKYHGKASFDIFSNMKSVLKNHYVFDIAQKYPPYKTPIYKLRRLMKFL